MKRVPKKTVSISVKLSPEEWDLLKAVANRIWPNAPITNAGIVAGLALMTAKNLVTAKEPSARKTAKKS
jgi:hypothetical protein